MPSRQAVTPDEGLLLLEVLAVFGVIVWVAALAWMATSDVVRYRAHHHTHAFRRAVHRMRRGGHE
ncbi:hypothetical protein [Aeromicrobium duanguangcaii]|uniref:hypothetical protein n=1 Tax=Aeromicrobium duanguangcaii TaxID=2968086 RepID=UPI0020170D56|nr:hypothetical protein [Aeromicrobium duanguangcaii]MCL3836351.1 hypothetical protein [Aeromicrobium duanguangcaii]